MSLCCLLCVFTLFFSLTQERIDVCRSHLCTERVNISLGTCRWPHEPCWLELFSVEVPSAAAWGAARIVAARLGFSCSTLWLMASSPPARLLLELGQAAWAAVECAWPGLVWGAGPACYLFPSQKRVSRGFFIFNMRIHRGLLSFLSGLTDS